MVSVKKPFGWILGIILFISGSLIAHIIGYPSFSDFFAQLIMLVLPETIFRLFYCRSERYEFLICFRIENLTEGDYGDYRQVIRNAFDMLGTLAGLTLTLLVITLSVSQISLSLIDEALLILPSFLAFIIFVIDIALSYSVTKKIPDTAMEKIIQRFYEFTLLGLFLLGVTLTWSMRSFLRLPVFTLYSEIGIISLILGFGFLSLFYWRAYMYESKYFKTEEKREK